MMTSSNGNIFRILAICAGNSPVPGEFPAQRPVTRSFDVFFDLRPNKRLSKQPWGWWFGTLSCSIWRHCNESGDQPNVSPWKKLINATKRHEMSNDLGWKSKCRTNIVIICATYAYVIFQISVSVTWASYQICKIAGCKCMHMRNAQFYVSGKRPMISACIRD